MSVTMREWRRTVCRTRLHRDLLELVEKDIAREGELVKE